MDLKGKGRLITNFIKTYALKYRVLLVIFTVALLLFLILGAISDYLASKPTDQHTADRWENDNKMAQVSIFVSEDQMVELNDIKRFGYQLKMKLIDAGVTGLDDEEDESEPEIIDTIGIEDMNSAEGDKDEPKEDDLDKLIGMSYCAQGFISMIFDNKSMKNVNAIGVGGDFFIFHPLKLTDGTYFGADDLMKDRIVIDESTAWQLFGSTDIIGQAVLIGDVPHYIAGVASKKIGRFEGASGFSNNIVYMSYDSLSKYGTIISGLTKEGEQAEDGTTQAIGGIGCIEVVAPNPVEGLLARISRESIGFEDSSIEVVDNTDRFSFISLIRVLKNFGLRSMQSRAICYPYWENEARGYEDVLSMILLFRLISLVILVFIFVYLIIDLYRNKKWTVRGITSYLAEKKYDFEVRQHIKKGLKRGGAAAGEETL